MNREAVDRHRTARLFYAGTWGILRFAVSFIIGAEGCACAAVSMDILLLSAIVFMDAVPEKSSELLSVKIRNKQYGSAEKLLRFILVSSVMEAVLGTAAVLSCFLFMNHLFESEPYRAQIVILILPAVLIFAGNGYLRSCFIGLGYRRKADRYLYVSSILTSISGMAGTCLMYFKGEKIALLLRNSSYSGYYGALGLIAGADIAQFILFLIQLAVYFPLRGRMRSLISVPSQIRQDKKAILRRTYVSEVFSSVLSEGILLVPLLSGYIIYSSVMDSFSAEAWGIYSVRIFSMLWGIGCLILIPFTGYRNYLAKIYQNSNTGHFRTTFGILFRLLNYLCLPAAMFVFSASKIFSALGTVTADENVLISARLSFALVLLIPVSIFLQNVPADEKKKKLGVPVLLISLAAHYAGLVLFSFTGIELFRSIQLAVIVMFLLYDVLQLFSMYYLAVRSNRWSRKTVLSAVSAVISAVPVFIAAEFLYDQMSALPAFILLFIIYMVLYSILSVLIGAEDSRNLSRIPAGRYLAFVGRMIRPGE